MASKPSMKPTTADPKKSPPKPVPEEAADEGIIDLTQFNDWVPQNAPSGTVLPSSSMWATIETESRRATNERPRHASADGSMAPTSGMESTSSMAPKLSVPKKPLGHHAWEIAAGEGMIDLTLLNQLQIGDVPEEAAPRGAKASRATNERPGHARAPIRVGTDLGMAPTPSMAPKSGMAPAPPAGQDASSDAVLPYAATCREAIQWRRQASKDGNVALLFDDLAYDPAPEGQSSGEGVLESRTAVCVLLVMGIAGIVGGAVGGFFLLGSHPIAGVYAGGALGWVAGFMVACLFILSAERDESRLRCPACGQSFPDGTELCSQCGGVLTGPSVNPVARGGLHAGSYALGGKKAVAAMALLGFVGGGFAQAVYLAVSPRSYLNGWGWGLIALAGLLLAYLGGYLLEFLLSVVVQTLRVVGSPPPPLPSPLSGRAVLTALGAVGIVCVYALPLVTLPLLPLALLHLSAGGMGKALNPRLALTVGLRRSGDFAVLWLVIFLWVAGLLLSLALAVAAFIGMDRIQALLSAADTPWANALRAGMSILLTALKSGMVSAFLCVFGLAIARCIGLFGRRSGLHRAA
jgi:hypothetical protein